jgi:hypothetical protein
MKFISLHEQKLKQRIILRSKEQREDKTFGFAIGFPWDKV